MRAQAAAHNLSVAERDLSYRVHSGGNLFMLVDLGGGTADITAHEARAAAMRNVRVRAPRDPVPCAQVVCWAPVSLREAISPCGRNYGSRLVDVRACAGAPCPRAEAHANPQAAFFEVLEGMARTVDCTCVAGWRCIVSNGVSARVGSHWGTMASVYCDTRGSAA